MSMAEVFAHCVVKLLQKIIAIAGIATEKTHLAKNQRCVLNRRPSPENTYILDRY
jgi:hypothetical protein